ncbi:polyglutamine-binding protein 1-like [Montipora capricornis]|uniref:polyglutamine-binding protein 1-like n=1 Tax=Montipora capricornis TaxID=246305 RepID=UPI0035F0FF42
MPLPPALQARLAKRGIIQNDKEKLNGSPKVDGPVKGCPNTVNPYHTCVEYCRKRYGENAVPQPPKDYNTVPLPVGWYLVPDPSSGSSYYWNTITNQVSWRHPLDPTAEVTLPASVVNSKKESDVLPNREILAPPGVDTEHEKEQVLSIGKHPSLVKGSQKRQEAAGKRKQDKEIRAEKRRKSEEVDPMDPAAYSDAPKGTWTTGLLKKGEAKTGVDTTANGPLFQMRPYPSPGAVLRANQQLAQKSVIETGE